MIRSLPMTVCVAWAMCLAMGEAVDAQTAEAELPMLRDGRELPRDGLIEQRNVYVEGAKNGVTTEVLVLEHPPVLGGEYGIEGLVSHSGVVGTGYIEMWSHFADGSRYFTRAKADHGPMKFLSGDSKARPFVLTFQYNDPAQPPTKLVLNVVLPGEGSVYLHDIRFFDSRQVAAGAWWSDQQGGLVGGITGSLVGVIGALIGVLCFMGVCRRWAMGLLMAMFLSGVAMLIVGSIALGLSQPYGVYYPLLLVGFINAILGVCLWPVARKRYEQIELRRMEAMDIA